MSINLTFCTFFTVHNYIFIMNHKYPGKWLNQNSKRWKRQSRNITRATQIGRKPYRWETKKAANNKLLQNYERADADGTLSRNEILKMKIVTDMKSRTHGDCKSKYDSF